MTYIVNDLCVKCKHTTCVEVCPVDCFYEGDLMLVINPDECIDCGVCVSECPIGAIEEESEENIIWAERGKELSKIWPNITKIKPALLEAEEFKDKIGKFEHYILPNLLNIK